MKSKYIYLTISIALLSYSCNTGISQQELAATVAAQTVTVTYDLNGGTGSLNPKRTQKGTYVTLASGDVLTPPPPDANNGQKKSFLVWSTTQDENSEGGEHYIGGMIYRAEKDLKLYALWGTDVTYEVTFDPNGGENPNGKKGLFSLIARKYKPLLIPNNINKVSKRYNYASHSDYYLFNGWNTQKDGRGEHYDRGSYYKMGKDSITLYAEWVIGIDGTSCGIEKMADIIGDSSVGLGSQEHFKLMSSGSQLVEDPETGTKDFQGIFDGDDFYLRFKITEEGEGRGFFKMLSGKAIVRNLILDGDIVITEPEVVVGMLAGRFIGTPRVQNVKVVKAINRNSPLKIKISDGIVGGIVGEMGGGEIIDCMVAADLELATESGAPPWFGCVGGIVGIMRGGSITGTKVAGSEQMTIMTYQGNQFLTQSHNQKNDVCNIGTIGHCLFSGGLVGVMDSGKIIEGNTVGSLSYPLNMQAKGLGIRYAGGLVGYMFKGEVTWDEKDSLYVEFNNPKYKDVLGENIQAGIFIGKFIKGGGTLTTPSSGNIHARYNGKSYVMKFRSF